MYSCKQPENEKKLPPNVVIILTDDQGWGDLSLHGNTNIETLNIDALARSGAVFKHFYVSPVCSPTRAEILTGRYNFRGGVRSTSEGGERLDLDEVTVAEIFKKAGYATAAYGKWHNGMQAPYHPNARGFDDYYGFASGHWGNYFSPMLEHNGKIVKGEGFIIDDFTNYGLQFMEKHQDEPFFLYLPYNTPHGPMQVPDRWWNKFENKTLEMLHSDPEMEDEQFTKAALAMCENIDWNVGRVTSKLKELGLAENTIMIYLSDNGPNSWRWNGGMKGRKGSTDEGGVRSPMFMAWPGSIMPGKKIETIAAGIDILPTLLDLAGIQYNQQKPLDGKSLKPLLLQYNPQWADRFIVNYWKGKVSIRSDQYRLGAQGQLFDMVDDPGQQQNIAETKPDIYEIHKAEQKRWEEEAEMELPENDNRTLPIGHPDFKYTQIPARDGKAHGKIKRSNRWPNCSFFTNWTSPEDKITWEAEVINSGDRKSVV